MLFPIQIDLNIFFNKNKRLMMKLNKDKNEQIVMGIDNVYISLLASNT